MMLSRVLAPSVAKEIRALLPVWLWSIALVGVFATFRDGGLLRSFGVLIYVAGSLALGALSIGHEYTHRTLPQLLSQPVGRSRFLVTKLSVLAPMLVVLAAVAWATALYPSRGNAVIVGLSVLCGLCLAPLLTMVARHPVAGIVFTIPFPGVMWILIDELVAEPLKLTVFWRVMVGVCAIGAVLGWRTFMRLEAGDGRGPHVHLRWSPGDVVAPAGRRHPAWWLVKKELGLQQLTLVLVAIYLVISLRLLGHVSNLTADVHGGLTALYSGMLALLIGSLTSAEERQLGVLESQLLLPIASSTQWLVKVAITIGLALLLAVGVPALIIAYGSRAIRINEWYVCAILILAVTSLYVSSLCNTGIRALLVSVFASPFVLLVCVQFRYGRPHVTMPLAVMLGGLLLVVLWFGLENHRSAERGLQRIGRQVFVMVGYLALAGVVHAVI